MRFPRIIGIAALVVVGIVGTPGPVSAGPDDHSCEGAQATIVGTPGDDKIIGSTGNDVIVGLGGDDEIKGLAGTDLICGGSESDSILGGADSDGLKGGQGDDRLGAGPNGGYLYGGPGDDIVSGGVLNGGTGDDLLKDGGLYYGDPGDDQILGNDVELDYSQAPRGIHVNLDRGLARGWGTDMIEGVRTLYGSTHSDVLIGSRHGEFISGVDGVDRVSGRGGDDQLFNGSFSPDDFGLVRGGEGADRLGGGERSKLVGGPGFDTAAYSHFLPHYGGVHADLKKGEARFPNRRPERALNRDKLDSVEAILGTDQVDILLGDEADNTLTSSDGADFVGGRAGDDVLGASDIASFTSPLRVLGGAGDDTINGGGASDDLLGGKGDDWILGDFDVYGSFGDDFLDGGAGTDELDGSDGADECVDGESVENCEA